MSNAKKLKLENVKVEKDEALDILQLLFERLEDNLLMSLTAMEIEGSVETDYANYNEDRKELRALSMAMEALK